MSSLCSQSLSLKQPATYWEGLFKRQKQLRIWDQQRHREKLAGVKADYKRKYENKLNDFKRHSDEKLAAQLQEFKEKEAAYRRHIAELEADLARYKGRGEKAPKASHKKWNKGRSRKRPQGKPHGAGGGRSLHEELRPVDEFINPTLEQRRCSLCGEIAEKTVLTADSDEVDWRYKVIRRRIRRRKCIHRCSCPGTPRFVVADHPLKAMGHSKYSDAFWIQVLVRKFYLQIPLSITIAELASAGLKNVKETTLIGGIKTIYGLIRPLIEAIVLQCKSGSQHGSDESRLSLFQRFGEDGGKHSGYLWQHHSIDTVVFEFVKRRSAEYLVDFFRETETILLADRHKLYKCKAMSALGNVTLAFCWAHQRRDFEKLLDKPGHKVWAGAYLAEIRRIYKYNAKRIKHIGTADFSRYDQGYSILFSC